MNKDKGTCKECRYKNIEGYSLRMRHCEKCSNYYEEGQSAEDETIYISDLISALEEVKREHGDIKVVDSCGDDIDDIANVLSVEYLDPDDSYLQIW